MKGGYVRLDPQKINRLMIELGIGPHKLYGKAKVKPPCGRRALNGERIRIATAQQILKALEVKVISSFLQPDPEDTAEDKQSPGRAERHINEWDSVGLPSRFFETSNGLQYCVYKMVHRHLRDRVGRGKCYMLSHLPTKDRKRLEEHLTRHPDICDKIGPHPQIPVNKTGCPDPNGEDYWVIDKWVEGETLEETLKRRKLAARLLPRVMRQIAEGLKVMHDNGIIRRELSPQFVLLRETDKSVVLTDFELGKMLEGQPTVRPDEWLDDPYRAPEIGAKNIGVTVDLFSWGRIFVHAATGQLPQQGKEAGELARTGLRKSVIQVVMKCVSKTVRGRPKDIDAVLKALRGWK